ncbi:MAG: GNAT family N-acetyltransferase [Bdellovibrionota bacterium]
MNNLSSFNDLELMPLTKDNVEILYSLVSEAHVREFLMEGLEMSRAECLDFIKIAEALRVKIGLGMYLVFRLNQPIGYCGFMETNPPSQDVDVVYAFNKESTGRGFATKICHTLVTLFRKSNFSGDLTAVVHPKNIFSIKVLEKNGFKNEGAASGELNHLLKYRYLSNH